jgi:hypothetical protein
MEEFSKTLIQARPGERVYLGDGRYATVGHGLMRPYGNLYRLFLWITDAQGRPKPFGDVDGRYVGSRSVWICIEKAKRKLGAEP